jgi:hypothetical protein
MGKNFLLIIFFILIGRILHAHLGSGISLPVKEPRENSKGAKKKMVSRFNSIESI